jgi:type VI secretion system protein ImpA
MTPAQLEALLAPISPERPGGSDASYSPEFDEIRRLRKGDDPSLSQGEWVHEIRIPQWPKVRDLCGLILQTRSKDLQVACWYVEAQTYLEGFPGFSSGLKLLTGLMSKFWDAGGLFPEDPEERVAKYEWFDAQIPMAIRSIPMTNPKMGGFSLLKWEESRLVENLGLRDPEAKRMAIAEGKLSGEAWDKSAKASGQGYYLRQFDHIQIAQQDFEAFEKRIDLYLGKESPGMEGTRNALQACTDLVSQMMRRFGLAPHMEAAVAAPAFILDSPIPPQVSAAMVGGSIPSRAEAIRKLREIAKFFLDHEPHSPVGPLAERAARWGEMPLEQWLSRVIKDENTLDHLRDLLDLHPEL